MNEMVFIGEQGSPVTTSKIVAEVFGKRNYNVLRDIRDLQCSDKFRELNFELCHEIKQLEVGSTRTDYYVMTKDGFTFLVMGYTGAKAGEFKEKFINRFNEMERQLRQASEAFLVSPQEVLEMKNTIIGHQERIISQQERIIILMEERMSATASSSAAAIPAASATAPVRRRRHKEDAPAEDDQPHASQLTDYGNMSRFADEFFRNEANFEHPISRLELWHRYLLFLGLPPRRSTVSCMFGKLRHVLSEYCRTHRIAMNPDVIYSCQSDFVSGYKRCSAYETAYMGNKPVEPEHRFLVRGARTFYFFHEGYEPKSCGELRPATGKEGMMP